MVDEKKGYPAAKYRYQLAEEILRNKGTDSEIQQRII